MDYIDKLKSEYPGVFGPVAASDYTTLAGMGDSVDYILDYWKDKGKEGVKFLKDFAFEHMTSPEVKGYIERSKERGEDLEKKRDEFSDALKGYMERSEKDALEKAKEHRGKLKISGDFDPAHDKDAAPEDLRSVIAEAMREAAEEKSLEKWAEEGKLGSADLYISDPTTGVTTLHPAGTRPPPGALGGSGVMPGDADLGPLTPEFLGISMPPGVVWEDGEPVITSESAHAALRGHFKEEGYGIDEYPLYLEHTATYHRGVEEAEAAIKDWHEASRLAAVPTLDERLDVGTVGPPEPVGGVAPFSPDAIGYKIPIVGEDKSIWDKAVAEGRKPPAY